jgi:outer membrane lipoprotein-sorting protein
MNRAIKIMFLAVLLSVAFSACRTTYQAGSEKVKKVSDRKIIRNVIRNYLTYNTLSYRFNGEFSDSGMTTSFNGTIRIKKDSIIWVSLSVVLGIELARIQITKDSVYFMNKIKDEYFIREVDYISNAFQVDVNYEILQSIITNQIFLYAEEDETINERRVEEVDDEPDPGVYRKTFIADTDSNQYVLKTYRKRKLKKHIKRNRPEIILQTYHVLPDIYKISNANINELAEKRELDISYSEFSPIDSVMVPYNLLINIKDKQKSVSLKLEYSKINLNTDISFPFTIPEKYKPIETRQQ